MTGGNAGGTLLVISDGHVNAGIIDVDQFASMTSKAYAEGLVTSTLGYGRAPASSPQGAPAAGADRPGCRPAVDGDGVLGCSGTTPVRVLVGRPLPRLPGVREVHPSAKISAILS
jgi:hypothetical protein